MKSAILAWAAWGLGIWMATLGAAWANETREFALGYQVGVQSCSATECTSLPGKATKLTVTLEKSPQSSPIREIWVGQAYAEIQLELGSEKLPLLAQVQVTQSVNRGSPDYWVEASVAEASSPSVILAQVGLGGSSQESLPVVEKASTHPLGRTSDNRDLMPVLRVGGVYPLGL